jgi:hypothetical protein
MKIVVSPQQEDFLDSIASNRRKMPILRHENAFRLTAVYPRQANEIQQHPKTK